MSTTWGLSMCCHYRLAVYDWMGSSAAAAAGLGDLVGVSPPRLSSYKTCLMFESDAYCVAIASTISSTVGKRW